MPVAARGAVARCGQVGFATGIVPRNLVNILAEVLALLQRSGCQPSLRVRDRPQEPPGGCFCLTTVPSDSETALRAGGGRGRCPGLEAEQEPGTQHEELLETVGAERFQVPVGGEIQGQTGQDAPQQGAGG